VTFPDSQDFFELYFRFQRGTEPPLIYHRWSAITCLSAYLGRQFWMPFGENRIFPNCYTMLIGHPGARKSTAIKLAKKLFSAAGYSSFAAEKTSKEKFLLDLEGLTEEDFKSAVGIRRHRKSTGLTSEELHEALFGKDTSDAIKEPKEVFIVADEFNEFVGSGNLEFLSLLGMLWDWDDPKDDYEFRLKNSKSVSIFQPTITILSGNTHAGFVEAFPPQAIGQGFLSRLILVYGEPSGKKIYKPPPPDLELRQRLIDHLQEIKKKIHGEATCTPDADRALETIYLSWKDLEDGRFKHYSNRRYTHLLKLSVLMAAFRLSTEVAVQDVLYANTILTFTEMDMPKALGEFGKSKDADVAGRIMQALYETNSPLSISTLLRIVKNDLDKASQLGDILVKLQNSGQVQMIPGQGYMPKQRQLDSKAAYVDMQLLQEYTSKHGMIRRVK